MGYILGLDVGDKRVGTALIDDTVYLVTPSNTFNRAAGEAEREITKLIASRCISTIVIGLPLNDDGSENSQCQRTRAFSRRLTRRNKVRVVFVDEYASSEEASEILNANQGRNISRGDVDSRSAALILERYIEGPKGKEISS